MFYCLFETETNEENRQAETTQVDVNAFNEDIVDAFSSETCRTSIDVNSLTENYNQILRDIFFKHAPECVRSITLRPNAPWFDDNLRAMKKQRRRYERRYLSTRLEVHRLIYTDYCKTYTGKVNTAKSDYYKSLISNSDEKHYFR